MILTDSQTEIDSSLFAYFSKQHRATQGLCYAMSEKLRNYVFKQLGFKHSTENVEGFYTTVGLSYYTPTEYLPKNENSSYTFVLKSGSHNYISEIKMKEMTIEEFISKKYPESSDLFDYSDEAMISHFKKIHKDELKKSFNLDIYNKELNESDRFINLKEELSNIYEECDEEEKRSFERMYIFYNSLNGVLLFLVDRKLNNIIRKYFSDNYHALQNHTIVNRIHNVSVLADIDVVMNYMVKLFEAIPGMDRNTIGIAISTVENPNFEMYI